MEVTTLLPSVRPSNSAGSTSSGGQYVRLEYDVNTGHSTSPQYALDTPSDTPFHNTIRLIDF